VAIGQTGRVSAALLELVCGDDPGAWAGLGFALDGDGACSIGPLTVRLDGAGGGLRGWVLGGPHGDSVDGIATSWRIDAPENTELAHPNGTTDVDHVVVLTDARDRTVTGLVQAGAALRRSGGPPELPAPMAFLRMGPVIVEVAERPDVPGTSLWGLTVVVPDVDALCAQYPGALGEPRAAVQPGRRIVTALRVPGLETPLAFITPR